jgi:hypothetical protein
VLRRLAKLKSVAPAAAAPAGSLGFAEQLLLALA